MKLYSTADITEVTQKAESTVRMLAAKHGIGNKIGGTWVFTEADVEALKQLPGPGRPKLAETNVVTSTATLSPDRNGQS